MALNKAGLHSCALWLYFFKQSFHTIGQKKNGEIPLARSGLTVEKIENAFNFFFKQALHLYDVTFSPSKGLKLKAGIAAQASASVFNCSQP